MIKASKKDRDLVVEILTRSFNTNKSVNYIIRQDGQRARRIKQLMQYSFDICLLSGEIYLSADKNACALITFPKNKKTSLQSILLDLRLAFTAIGLSRIRKVLARESAVSKLHPSMPFLHLWFIGVHPSSQHKGVGSILLKEIIQYASTSNLSIYLETSTTENIPWYKRNGFVIYKEINFGYTLHCLKN